MKIAHLIAKLLAVSALSAASMMSAHAQDTKPEKSAEQAPAAASVDDKVVNEKIKAALAEYKQVVATTSQGVVLLSGATANADDATRAIQLASAVPGVKEVKSELTVATK